MVNNHLKIGGGVCFWSLANWSDRDRLLEGLTYISLNNLCPPPRSVHHCLRSALAGVFKGDLIKPLKGGGLEVVEVLAESEESNSYTQKLVAKIEAADEKITLKPYDSDWAQSIMEEYARAKGMVHGDAVADMLIKFLDSLGGTRLRPTGGIYWLPEDQLNRWQEVTAVVESVAQKGKSCCYLLRHQMDHDAVRAVRDAIVAEVSESARKLHEEVTGGDLGERALQHREQAAQDLREKIKLYEDLLGCGLASLHEAVDTAEQAAAAAVMLAAAGGVQEVA